MASFKRRQSSDYNQSVPETEFIPETHAYQEKHFQPTLNQPVPETHSETEYGSTVTPDEVVSRADKNPRSTVMERTDQPGELDLASGQVEQNVQGNSDPGTQYSTPDVSSGVSSGPGGMTAYGGGAAAVGSTTATTVVASSTIASVSSVAITTVGAAVIAATLILPLVIGVPSAIIFDEISVTDTTVYYSIYFEDYEEDMDLTVSLHNNFTDRSHKVESEYFSMMEENLKPGMDYKITVYGSLGTVLDERTVTTQKTSPEPTITVDTAEFSVSDGLIHLTATVDDPNGRWSDYSMVFYDVKDNVRTEVKRVSISDFSSEVTMLPGLAKDTYVDGVLTVECTEDGEKKTVFEKDMTAYSNLYIGFKTPPRIINGTITVDCTIVDTESIRSNYHATVCVSNANDTSDSFITDGALVDGLFTATGVPNYTFHKGFVKVTWDGETDGHLVYNYNTMTVDAATMTKGSYEYGGDSYEVQFTVELTLNDDFNYLTDSSGNWRSDKYPVLSAIDKSPPSDAATFVGVTRTGDNTYVATYLADPWTDASMYRMENKFIVDSSETELHMSYIANYPSYTTRDSSDNVHAYIVFYCQTTINSAKAVSDDGTWVPCDVRLKETNHYTVDLDLTSADPYATYSIYLYDYRGENPYRQDGVTFEYPIFVSATYNTADGNATVVIDYPESIYMPDYLQTSTITYDGDRITMVFEVASDSPVLTGQQYFRFKVQDVNDSDYYWRAVFTT